MSVLVDRALGELAGMLDRLYSEASQALEAALDGGAETVAAHCREAEKLRTGIIERSVEYLARFQPVAIELRRFMAYMEASYDLFRVSRYALETARLLARIPGSCSLEEARDAAAKAREMLEQAYRALRREDPGLARRVLELDEEIDRMYLHSLDQIVVNETLHRCEVAETLVLRHMERVADHAVYIASAAHYVATGRRLAEGAP